MVLVDSDEDAELLLLGELSYLKLDLEVLLLADHICQQLFDSLLDLLLEVLFSVVFFMKEADGRNWHSNRRVAYSLAFKI